MAIFKLLHYLIAIILLCEKHKLTVMESRSLVVSSYELETDEYGAEQKRF